MFRLYYSLTKPGIIYGNLLTAAGGFLLASTGRINYWLFLATLAGVSLVIASACVCNNYIDREIDKKMARTKQRALVNGLISDRSAIIYASCLGVAGVVVLAVYTNLLTVCIGLVAFFFYVVLYGVAKRHSVHGTLVGSIPGAAPVVAGYCAVTDRFDGGAFIVFLILVTWQMAHFYAIAIYRFDDYKAAGLPVMPVKKGLQTTKIQMLLYISIFIIATSALTVFHYTEYAYLIVMLLLGIAWLYLCLQGFKTSDSQRWARNMFLISLVVVLVLSIMLSIGARLP